MGPQYVSGSIRITREREALGQRRPRGGVGNVPGRTQRAEGQGLPACGACRGEEAAGGSEASLADSSSIRSPGTLPLG